MDNFYAVAARAEHTENLRHVRHAKTHLQPAKKRAEKFEAALVTYDDKRKKVEKKIEDESATNVAAS